MLEAWESLSPPAESGARNVLLADSGHPLDFRIGQDSRGQYVFLLDADRPAGGIPKLPKVMGISIELEEPKAGRVRLVLGLQDKADLQIFSHMCAGLMLATRSNAATRSSEGFVRTLEELHRWHEMLKRRQDRRLTRSERIGLVGELLFLRDELLPRMGLIAGLHAWTGHERHEQDFVVGSTIFEVKTQVVTADRMISVSSEDQLDPRQGRILICNQGIAPAPEGAAGSCTLNSIAKELADLAKATGGGASDLLGIGYLGAGYEPHPEYEEETWTRVDRALYEVRDDFPRIERGELRPGVEQVRYRIRASDCQPYARDIEATFEELIDG
ncbi:hypothetical protein GCM10010923_03670 [Blastomonas marina]|uniref:PD-(D/E)XK motif protein n=1 Tax=Blastomonas marina TaxID=1867408 RepID=A0ABQ1F3Z3_9SPHN|nr:PD-(D/E)XK motif protein [Blastomonas marina]GFZ98716.1 hypothetical protein GCM10010923_03670 [Blastomonas marina]